MFIQIKIDTHFTKTINVDFISYIQNYSDGSATIYFKDGTDIAISKKQCEQLLEKMGVE